MRDHHTHRPLAGRGLTVEIHVTQPGKRAGQIAVRLVVLTQDALGDGQGRTAPRTLRGDARGEVPQLVMRHEQSEADALLVVLMPGPRRAELRVGQADRGAHETLDRLRRENISGAARRSSRRHVHLSLQRAR